MEFLYPFANFLQPGILWPALAPFKPMFLLSALGLAIGLIAQKGQPRQAAFGHPVFIWLCIFVLIQVISVYYSGVSSLLSELGFWNVFPIFVAVSILLMRTPEALSRYVWGMLFGCSVVIAYGIYSVFSGLAEETHGGRAGAYGMYENHNDYTFIVVMVLPFAWLMLRATKNWIAKLLLLALLGACVVGTFLSLSRGGIIALVFELGLIFWLSTTGKRRVLCISAVAMLGAAAIVHQWTAREENQAGQYTAADAKSSRFELWKAGAHMVVAHPLLGIGSRRFGEYAQDYGEISSDNRGKNSHNTFIEVLATTGILGLSAFAMMLFSMFRELSRPRRDAHPVIDPIRVATLVSLGSIVLRCVLDAKAYDWSFYTLAALTVSIATLAKATQHSPAEQSAQPEKSGPVKDLAALHARRPAVYGQRRTP